MTASSAAATVLTEPTSNYVKINGLSLHYLDWGGDETRHELVLLHGGGANVHWWDTVAPQLVSCGRVRALDFRGHGRSQWSEHYGPNRYVEDTIAFLDLLGRRVVLVGHSMGGVVAQWLAVERPDLLEALVLIDAPPGPPPLWHRLKWRWRRRASGGTRPELPSAEHIKRKFRLVPPETYLSADQLAELGLKSAEQLPNGRWAFRFDPQTRAWRRREAGRRPPQLRAITAPTLILRGEGSTLVSAGKARSMHRRIANSTVRQVPRAYHHVTLDNPADCARMIVEFINGLQPTG